jgi:hypothetical protein
MVGTLAAASSSDASVSASLSMMGTLRAYQGQLADPAYGERMIVLEEQASMIELSYLGSEVGVEYSLDMVEIDVGSSMVSVS